VQIQTDPRYHSVCIGSPLAQRQAIVATRFSQIPEPDAPTPSEKSGLGQRELRAVQPDTNSKAQARNLFPDRRLSGRCAAHPTRRNAARIVGWITIGSLKQQPRSGRVGRTKEWTSKNRPCEKSTSGLLPFAILSYFLAYIDRINVSFAALTMRGDLDISASDYGFALGTFYWGYFIFDVGAI
jgi:hypothetical protein